MSEIRLENVGSPIHDRGPVQGISNGRWVYPLDVQPEEIFLADIASALSRQCRFVGHLREDVEHYSVAQHSVIVSYLVPEEDAPWGLLHDAPEYIIGDVTRPMKQVLEAKAPGALNTVDLNIERAIATRFGLPWPMPTSVKLADNIAVYTEKRDVLALTTLDWGPGPEPMQESIKPLRAFAARDLFLDRAAELGIS